MGEERVNKMILTDRYTKTEKSYRKLTLAEVKALTGHALVISNQGDVVRVKINGKVRTWKRDVTRFEVPIKYGLYEYATLDNLDRFVKEEN
jgi:hypothetical protein